MSRWLTEEEQRAWRGLLRMTSQLNARMNRQLQDDYGISLPDYDMLVVLSEAPGGRLRVFEIAGALVWEQSRVSHQLARMQRRGLVTREECATDARGAFAVLTAAGRAAIERAAPAHVDTVRQLVFDGLSHDRLAALTAITSEVLERLRETQLGLLAAVHASRRSSHDDCSHDRSRPRHRADQHEGDPGRRSRRRPYRRRRGLRHRRRVPPAGPVP